jgi:PAS domain S-box-containing protein
MSINGVPVFDEVTGAFKGYRGTGRNITAEVRNSELLRALIDAIPAMINVKDTDSRYVLMNAYQARLYGTTPEAAVGKTAAELLGVGYGSYTGAIDRRVIESGEATGYFEETYAGVDGIERHWLTAKLPLKDVRGAVRHVISIAMDITAQKETEQQVRASQQALSDAIVQVERASRAKSDFLTNMSHELRTPLNAIIGFSEVLAGELMGPLGSARYKGYAQDIYRSGRYLHDLISDMLDMAKIEAGKRDLVPEEIDAVAEIENAARMLHPRAKAGDVALECDLAAAPRAFRADRRAFRQILLNIVGNAVKFTPAGGRVSISMERADGDLVLKVADTGIGIAAEQIGRLGTPFFRIEAPQHATTEGTGLGLALTKSLVKLHGWRIAFESRVGRGTVVTIAMPGQVRSEPAAENPPASAA